MLLDLELQRSRVEVPDPNHSLTPPAGHQAASVGRERKGLDVSPVPTERSFDPSARKIDHTDPLVDGDEHPLVVEERHHFDVGFGTPQRLTVGRHAVDIPGGIKGSDFPSIHFRIPKLRHTDPTVNAPPSNALPGWREGNGKNLVPTELEVTAMAAVGHVPEPHPAHVDRHLLLGLIGRVGLFVRVIVLFAEHAGRGHDLSIGAEDDLIDLVANIDLAWHSGGRSVLSERQEDERPVGCAGSEQVTAP